MIQIKTINFCILSLIFLVQIHSQSLLSNRFDFVNVNITDFSDQNITEFTICGFSQDQLNAMIKVKEWQSPIDRYQKKWQKNMQILANQDYSKNTVNSTNFYKCRDPTQQITQFAVKTKSSSWVQDYLTNLGFKQQLSCQKELIIRKYLKDWFGTNNEPQRFMDLGVRLVRMVFHDALDFSNLMTADGNDVSVQNTGIDFCFYGGLKSRSLIVNESDGDAHRGFTVVDSYILRLDKSLRQLLSAPDLEVLGSILSLESHFQGPKVQFKYGRKNGECFKNRNILCINNCYSQKYFLKNSPSVSSWDPNVNFQFMKNMGFSKKESIALLGAHTLGGIQNCTGFDISRLDNDQLICKKSIPKNYDYISGLFFDQTPIVFDNNYFKILLKSQNYQAPTCKYAEFLSENMDNATSQDFACNKVTYCNVTSDGRSFLRSLNEGATFKTTYRRLGQTPADWNVLLDQESLGYVTDFANNQTDFFQTFSQSYYRLSNLGYSDSQIDQCQPLNCNLNFDQFTCSNLYDTGLQFQTNTLDTCQVKNQMVSNCQFVGHFGDNGQIQCDSQTFYCPMSQKSQSLITDFQNEYNLRLRKPLDDPNDNN